ncbi:FMN-binding split barrel [Xylaria nigripes]|nr:FMN-binding split barrel [Xylaria nigripes]
MSKHPDFKTVEASRPDWKTSGFRVTKTADPDWKPGQGVNHLDMNGSAKKHVLIKPLLISGITPRPIGFVSTRTGGAARTGTETLNLAPFSYFNIASVDPPLFTLGIASPLSRPKDTLRNLVENGECTVNIISEDFLEAANSTSMDLPPSFSEWVVSGLTPVHDVETVSTPRAQEAVFAVECRVESIREFESRIYPGQKSSVLVLLEGQRFWVREDALNEETNMIAPEVLRPMSRLGGIMYGRTVEAVELPRSHL